ncbi:Small-conductance mechanosensitive channel [Nitrosomonas sp. Nm51]|uniref:mechanosensitive ion channel family protein n=1 Tax=Nitrosomonas sp. Nm51 TaxID=133720 RepID=UPI0008BBC8C3|nr:mechanosensitive ion channel family protein [Nitrosomonas sp. Nm51]SEQ79929.1 Small-conductance mechanosensitive channel [Nitrosomonas sp. Nm51]
MYTTFAAFILSITLVTSPLCADQLTDLIAGETEPTQEAATQKVIEVNASEQDDKKIQKRLQKIFSEIDALKSITISVSNGIVTLRGNVSSASAENKAIQLSLQVKGVVEIKNELAITHDLKERLGNTWLKLENVAKEILTSFPVFLLAIIVFALFWLFGRWISRRQSLYRKIAPNYFIANLFGQITHLIFILLGLVLALSLLDLTALLGSILGAAGIIGLAVGFAVRDTVENYIASILLSLRNPFEVNDLVTIDGIEGNVVRLTARATILISPDGNHIRIPNSSVFKAVIINYTRSMERRFEFDMGIDTHQDLLKVQALALQTLNSIEGVLEEPQPMVTIEKLGDSNIVLRVYGWTNQEKYSFLKVRSEAIRQIKLAFDQENIVMPEPIYQIKVTGNETNIDVVQKEGGAQQTPYSSASQQPAVIADAAVDISNDDTIERIVKDEHERGDAENLLNKNAAQE